MPCIHVTPTLTICRPPGPTERVTWPGYKRRKYLWCFQCHKRTMMEWLHIWGGEWYGWSPPWLRCLDCDGEDMDLFPGRTREWEGS